MINLMQGDCLELLKNIPDGSVDMILTDPPYGMSFVSGYRKVAFNAIANDDSLDWIDDLASELHRIAKDESAHYVFCSYHHIDKFKQAFERHFKIKNILTWVKTIHQWATLKAILHLKQNLSYSCKKGAV